MSFRQLFVQNWKKQIALWVGLIVSISVAYTVPEPVARFGSALLISHYVVALTPRATLNGRELGAWPSGELYDRWFADSERFGEADNA